MRGLNWGILWIIAVMIFCTTAQGKINSKADNSPYSAYLMAYCGPDGKLRYAASRNARRWEALNEGRPVFKTEAKISTPFLQRVHHQFHLVASTEDNPLNIAHWESDDLLNWTGGSHPVVDSRRKMVLAPEFFYSGENSLFYVYWTSLNEDHNAIFYTKTKDWNDMDPTKTAVYYDPGDDIVDLTLVKHKEKYYGFHKKGNIGDMGIHTQVVSNSLNPEICRFTEDTGLVNSRLALPTQTTPTRSPQVLKLIHEDVYYVYANPVEGPLEAWQTRDFKTYARILVYPPETAQLGAMIPITEGELRRLQENFSGKPAIAKDGILRLEDMDLVHMVQGWGKPGIKKTIIDEPLTLNGRVFEHGVGTHAISRLTIDLKGAALAFKAWVGSDDENPEDRQGRGSVDFKVYVDKKKVFDSGVMKIFDAPKRVDVNLRGAKRLDLIVMDGGDNIRYDHADWADAHLVLDRQAQEIPVTVPRPVNPLEKVILTPPAPAAPRINAPLVLGAGEHREFSYYIPITGERPLELEVTGLPDGLLLDRESGMLIGQTGQPGDYPLVIKAANTCGSATKEILLKVGDGLAKTPPMGWNSWNCWGKYVKAEDIKAAADALVESGLIDHGWTYVVIDDAWQGVRDPETNLIEPNDKFPDMKALADYVHSRGLKFGIYTDVGYNTCQGYEGTLGYESLDAQTYANWGVDYVKNDFCYAFGITPREVYSLFGDALKSTGRDIVYSICTAGYAQAWEWARDAGGHLWRTSADITDNWPSVYSKVTGIHQDLRELAGPGHWNDPDMLVVGKVGWGRNLHESDLTPYQQYSHISLWCLVAAPLMIGCDLSDIDDFTLNLLSNDEVLAVNQDPLGKQGRKILEEDGFEVWVKELWDGSKAVGIFNFAPLELDDIPEREYVLEWKKLGLPEAQSVRDLWRQKDLGIHRTNFKVSLPEFGVSLVKVTPVEQ